MKLGSRGKVNFWRVEIVTSNPGIALQEYSEIGIRMRLDTVFTMYKVTRGQQTR